MTAVSKGQPWQSNHQVSAELGGCTGVELQHEAGMKWDVVQLLEMLGYACDE